MKRILVCTNYDKDRDLTFTMEVLDYLRKRGAEAKAFFPLTPAEALPVDMPDDALCPNPGTYIRGADLLLCLGADGTMLRLNPVLLPRMEAILRENCPGVEMEFRFIEDATLLGCVWAGLTGE